MKKQKIGGTKDKFLISSNNYEDDNCPVCKLMRIVKKENREPTMTEIIKAMQETEKISKLDTQ